METYRRLVKAKVLNDKKTSYDSFRRWEKLEAKGHAVTRPYKLMVMKGLIRGRGEYDADYIDRICARNIKSRTALAKSLGVSLDKLDEDELYHLYH